MTVELKLKAEKAQVNVEDLVELAVSNDVSSIPFLLSGAETYGWSDLSESKNNGIVPLASWAVVIASYLENGYEGFIPFVKDSRGQYLETATIVTSILDDIKTTESVISTINLFHDLMSNPSLNKGMSRVLVGVFNRLLSFPPTIKVNLEDEEVILCFLCRFLKHYNDEGDRANVFCAFRGVGNKDTIKLIKSFPKLTGSWKGVENIAIKSIKKKSGK